MDITYTELKLKEDSSSKIHVCRSTMWSSVDSRSPSSLLRTPPVFNRLCFSHHPNCMWSSISQQAPVSSALVYPCGVRLSLMSWVSLSTRCLCCTAVMSTDCTRTLPHLLLPITFPSIQVQHLPLWLLYCPSSRSQQSVSRAPLAHSSTQGAMVLLLTLSWWTNIKKTCFVVWKMSKTDIGLSGGRKQMACCLDTQLTPYCAADQTAQWWK